jgi:hypothetical protein
VAVVSDETPAERARREREEDNVYRAAQRRGHLARYEAEQRRRAQPPPQVRPPDPWYRQAIQALGSFLLVVLCLVGILVAQRACAPDPSAPPPEARTGLPG